MTSREFRDLKHGDKIRQPGCKPFIVHNNHRSGGGMVVAVRTEVIPDQDYRLWEKVTGYNPIGMVLKCGTYTVRIIDEG